MDQGWHTRRRAGRSASLVALSVMLATACVSGRTEIPSDDGGAAEGYVPPWVRGGTGAADGGGEPPFPEESELWPSEEETGFWDGDAPDEDDPFPEDPPEEDTPEEGEEPGEEDPDEEDPIDPPNEPPTEDPPFEDEIGGTVGGFGENAPAVKVPAYGVVYDWRRVLQTNPDTGWDEVGRELRRLRNAGVRYVRVQFPIDAGVSDLDAEVAPRLDQIVGRAASAQLYVLPVLLRYGTREDESYGPLGVGGTDPALPEMERFARWANERYGMVYTPQASTCGRERMGVFWREHCDLAARPIRIWEVWDAPNSPSGWGRPPNATDYASLLRGTRLALRSVHPNTRVIMGGLAFGSNAIDPADFIEGVTQTTGGSRLFDAVALEPYSNYASSASTRVLRVARRMRRLGLFRPEGGRTAIWITEVGWALPVGERCGEGRYGNCERNFTVENRARQRQRLRAFIRRVRRRQPDFRVGAMMWNAFEDIGPPAPSPWTHDVGLVRHDGSSRMLGWYGRIADRKRWVRPPVLRR